LAASGAAISNGPDEERDLRWAKAYASATHSCLKRRALDRSHLDLPTPIGRGLIALLSAMIEDKRQSIVKRANGSRWAAKARVQGVAGSPNCFKQAEVTR